MNKSDAPIGQRFSHVHLPREEALSDSPRMRVRLLKAFEVGYVLGFDATLEEELGILLPRVMSYPDWQRFFTNGELKDVLDAITIAYQHAFTSGAPNTPSAWRTKVERIFKEEGLRYRVDSACGVHFTIDAQYEFSIVSTVSGLGNPRHAVARQAFDDAQAALDRAEPDFKEALRDIFEAVEVVFKLILPETRRISSRDITEKLKPLMASMYPGSATAITVAGQYLDSLGAWVNSVHNYRHGQPLEEAPQPPLDLSVALMSSGVAYLRWLIGIDHALQGQAK